jgi:EAL domain-containing protein (putative c-di-GMP-specific phosphodiesterase class I)
VNNVDRSASDGAVASAILSLGKSLDLIVTAEGIERSGQLEWLRSRGCNEAQGFLLSRSLSAKDLENRYLLAADAQKPIDARSGIGSWDQAAPRAGRRI